MGLSTLTPCREKEKEGGRVGGMREGWSGRPMEGGKGRNRIGERERMGWRKVEGTGRDVKLMCNRSRMCRIAKCSAVQWSEVQCGVIQYRAADR
jgi:hypothetical protein